MEFPAVGHAVFRDSHSGEEYLWQEIGRNQGIWTYIYAGSDTDHVGSVRNYGYGAACGIFGQYVRSTQEWSFGRYAAAYTLHERVLGIIDCLHRVYYPFPRQIIP